MKAVNKISRILAVVCALAAFVMFFMPFVKLTAVTGEYTLIGGELAFGKNIEGVGRLYKSSQFLFCFILTGITVLFSALTFTKFKKMRYWAPAMGLVTAIYMLVAALSSVGSFVDSRPLILVSGSEYTIFVLLVSIALFASVVFGICHLIIDERIAVAEGKCKYTIAQRLVRTLRDYKSEITKIVWPGVNDVVKNTLVVIVVCLIIGAFIWLLDFGLGLLMDFITKI